MTKRSSLHPHNQSQTRHCSVCQLSKPLCCCDQIRPFVIASEITVLQDPREAGNKKNTLRLASQAISNLAIVQPSQGLALDDTGLLFPSPESQAIETAQDLPRRWLLLDASWKQCHALRMRDQRLQALPSFHFKHPPPSQYQIRKRPRSDGLATIEAIAYLLSFIEPHAPHQHLNEIMQAFNQRWLAQIPEAFRGHYDR